ncbi:MAG: succinate dehydrogenase [Rhodospirillaceae bacterium]
MSAIVRSHRDHPLWYAFLLHRLSGLALALFLPAHFFVLGLALEGATALDGALNWTQGPLVKVAEFGLVFLLAVHMFGGLRILALEFLPWSPRQKTYAAAAAAAAFCVACGFFLNAV